MFIAKIEGSVRRASVEEILKSEGDGLMEKERREAVKVE
jgi:hypothetical protein